MSHFVTTVPVLGWTWSPGCFWSSWCPWSLWSCGFSWSKWCSWWSWTWCKLSFILFRLLFLYSVPNTNTQKKWMEPEAVLLANLYDVFRENCIRIFIDMDSYAQLGDSLIREAHLIPWSIVNTLLIQMLQRLCRISKRAENSNLKILNFISLEFSEGKGFFLDTA